MLVLRKDLQERIGGEIRSDFLEINARLWFAFNPEPDGRDFVAMLDHEICQLELAVEFEGPCVHRESAGCRAWLSGLIYNPYLHSELGKPKGED